MPKKLPFRIPANYMLANFMLSALVFALVQAGITWSGVADYLDSLDETTWSPWMYYSAIMLIVTFSVSGGISILITYRKKEPWNVPIIVFSVISAAIITLVYLWIVSWTWVVYNAPTVISGLHGGEYYAAFWRFITYFSLFSVQIAGTYQPAALWWIILLVYIGIFELLRIVFASRW